MGTCACLLCLCGACNTFSLIVKSIMSGLDTISVSSVMSMGFVAVPSLSSATVAGGIGSPALRQVACRAKQEARCGADDEVEETVDMEEIDDAREDRDRSDIIDSGLEREDATLAPEGLRDANG